MPSTQARREQLRRSLLVVGLASVVAAVILFVLSMTLLAKSPVRPYIMVVGGVELITAMAIIATRDSIVERASRRENATGARRIKNGR